MTNLIRVLNARGLSSFNAYVASQRDRPATPPPFDLLSSPDSSERFDVDISVERQPEDRAFASRFAFGFYLHSKLDRIERAQILRRFDLWNWLSLFYFDQICPVGPDGTRQVLANEVYFMSSKQKY